MKNYKDVCGNNKCVWFEIAPNEVERFLKWAKKLGCVWINGSEIEPDKGSSYLHFSIHNDGKLACVDMIAWFNKDVKKENIEKYVFSEYLNGIKVNPKSHILI